MQEMFAAMCSPVFGTHKGEPNNIYAIQPDGGKTLLAQLSTDLSGNTVLVGANGVVIPTLGANTITVGNGGTYASMDALFDYARTQQLYSSITTGAVTANITQHSFSVVISGGTIDSGAKVRTGDAVSFDAGATYYIIRNVISDVLIILETSIVEATATGVSATFIRPDPLRIIALPGDHVGIDLDTTLPMFCSIGFMPGAQIVDPADFGAPGVHGMSMPKSGLIELDNAYFNFSRKSAAASIASSAIKGYGTTGDTSYRSVLKARNVKAYGYMSGGAGTVDIFSPAGSFGRIELVGCDMEAFNDGFFAKANIVLLENTSLRLKATALVETGALVWQQRMFSSDVPRKNLYLRNSLIEIDQRAGTPSSVSRVFNSANTAGTGKIVADNCVFRFLGEAAASCSLVGEITASSCTIEINGGRIETEFTSGTMTLLESRSYTGTGSLTLKGTNLGGCADGTLGAFTLTKTGCIT